MKMDKLEPRYRGNESHLKFLAARFNAEKLSIMSDYNNEYHPVSLENKIAVVAGGSNKAGRAIAEKLAQTGARVVIADVNLINAELVVQAIKDKYKTEATAVTLNTKEITALASVLNTIVDTCGGIDVWINAGGTHLPTQQDEISSPGPASQIDEDIRDVFASCEEVARYIAAINVKGIIVNVLPARNFALDDHAESDGHLSRLTRSLSEKFQHLGLGIFTVCPVPPHATVEGHAGINTFKNESLLLDNLAASVIFCITVLSQSTTGELVIVGEKSVRSIEL